MLHFTCNIESLVPKILLFISSVCHCLNQKEIWYNLITLSIFVVHFQATTTQKRTPNSTHCCRPRSPLPARLRNESLKIMLRHRRPRSRKPEKSRWPTTRTRTRLIHLLLPHPLSQTMLRRGTVNNLVITNSPVLYNNNKILDILHLNQRSLRGFLWKVTFLA